MFHRNGETATLADKTRLKDRVSSAGVTVLVKFQELSIVVRNGAKPFRDTLLAAARNFLRVVARFSL
jgi:hypothetical protein